MNLQMNVTLQLLFKISFLVSFCSYVATIAELLVPNQPVNIDFPETLFTNQYRSFNTDWFKRFGWLHYDISRNAAFLFVCIKALSKGQISTGNVESAFLISKPEKGFGRGSWFIKTSTIFFS